MNKLDTKISKHARDIIQKYASGLFKDTTLEFYGIKTAKIKELINVELPVVEVSANSTDYIFLLEDDTYLHFEFQTTYSKNDIIRFASYDISLYERDKRDVSTVIIYSANIKEADTSLNIGSLSYNPNKIMMYEYDGNNIFKDLEEKINANIELTDIDMLNLIFVPLMKNSISKEELAIKSIKLAQTIKDKNKQNTCIASIFAFASKYLDDNKLDELLEVLQMTDLATKLATKLVDNARKDEKIEIAKNLLNLKTPIDTIVTATGLSADTIKHLKEELNKD